MQKVAIISAGQWRAASREQGHYDEIERRLLRYANEAMEGPADKKEKAAEGRTFEDIKEALDWLNGHGVIVFVTRGMAYEAKQVAERWPGIRVLVFSGLIPSGTVVYVCNGWDLSRDAMQTILLKTYVMD